MTLQEVVDRSQNIISIGNPTEDDKRILLVYYLVANKGIFIGEILHCKINDYPRFEQNYEIAKAFFNSFKTE